MATRAHRRVLGQHPVLSTTLKSRASARWRAGGQSRNSAAVLPSALPCYDPVMDPGKNTVETRPRPQRCTTPAASNMLALTVKNLLKIRRNLPMLLFVFLK